MTAAELSRKSGISQQLISSWLAGCEPKTLSHVKKVVDVLNTTVDHLCYGNGKDEKSQKITELDALFGDQWIGGLFEIRFRRVKK